MCLWILSGIVLAIGDPDSVSIGDVYVFRDVIETGDQLYFVRYDVSYNATPSENAEDTWQMALYDSSGSLITTRPLNYYQHNIISIYLQPAEALTWEAAHKVRIMGMPSVFGTLTEGTNMRTRTLASGDYYEESFLGGVMTTQAGILETDWSIDLLTATGKLNSTGSTFFLEAVPGLGTMCPEIFDVVVSDVEIDYVTYPHTYGPGLSGHAGSKLSGAVGEIGGLIGVSSGWMSWWMILVIFLMLAGIIFAGVGNPGWAMAGGFAMIAVGGFLFGGSVFTFAITLVLLVGIGFGIYFILGRFA